jgi:hypothetical protein
MCLQVNKRMGLYVNDPVIVPGIVNIIPYNMMQVKRVFVMSVMRRKERSRIRTIEAPSLNQPLTARKYCVNTHRLC